MKIGRDLPAKWSIRDLPDLLFFQEGPGVRNWQFTDHGVKLLNVRNINFGKINLDATSVHISEEEAYGKYAHFLADAGDLVIASSGIVVDNFHNKIAFISEEHLPLCMNTSTIRFKVLDRMLLDIKFFRIYLATDNFKSQLRKLITGSAQLNFGPSHLRKIKIPLPPLDHQICIAHLLGKVEGLIAQRKQHLQQLDDLLKSVFLEMFGDPVRNEKGWDKAPLEKLGSVNRGVSKHRPRNDPKLLGGKYPLIQTGEVSNAGTYITTSTQTYSDLGFAQSKLWPVRTLCITIAANIAQTGILTFEACFPDSVVGFIADKNVANPLYVHGLFWFFQAILEKNAPAAAQKNINLEILRGLEVPKPPVHLQNDFATIVEKIEGLKSRYQQSLTDLEALYGALSQQAFKGELDLSRVACLPRVQQHL